MFDDKLGNALTQDGKGNFVINGAVVPKRLVKENYQLFGLSKPPQ